MCIRHRWGLLSPSPSFQSWSWSRSWSLSWSASAAPQRGPCWRVLVPVPDCCQSLGHRSIGDQLIHGLIFIPSFPSALTYCLGLFSLPFFLGPALSLSLCLLVFSIWFCDRRPRPSLRHCSFLHCLFRLSSLRYWASATASSPSTPLGHTCCTCLETHTSTRH